MLYLVYGHEGGAVIVAGELGVLDEGIFLDELLEFFTGDKVVVFAVHFARAGQAGGVWRDRFSRMRWTRARVAHETH